MNVRNFWQYQRGEAGSFRADLRRRVKKANQEIRGQLDKL
jgi:hypothetical protein